MALIVEMLSLLESLEGGGGAESSTFVKQLKLGGRMMDPKEYPESWTAPRGAFTPKIVFGVEHPKGRYYAEDQGAGHLAVYFVAKRKNSKPKNIGAASGIAGAWKRILDHEDEMVEPDAPRETGKDGPVSIFALGKRKH
jgi:hypothetical protein